MEPLIYIEEKDKNASAKLARGFAIEDTLKRAYINALASELAMKYLAQEGINVTNIYNLHNIHKIREEFDIADVMLPNIHIDVRMVYDENCIFIPKAHFEYGLTPDIYLVFLMPQNEDYVKFLGFFEPKLINKNNQNDKYYFIEKEKLSHPSDLKAYVENFNGNTTEALSDEELANGQTLALRLIDHDITDDDKRNLIKMLLKSSALREDLIEFDNFEFVSYHVATNEDLTKLSEFSTYSEPVEQPAADEFDIFEQPDGFETADDLISEANNLNDNLGDDLLNDFDLSFEEPVIVETQEETPAEEEFPQEETNEVNLSNDELETTDTLDTEDISTDISELPATDTEETAMDLPEESLDIDTESLPDVQEVDEPLTIDDIPDLANDEQQNLTDNQEIGETLEIDNIPNLESDEELNLPEDLPAGQDLQDDILQDVPEDMPAEEINENPQVTMEDLPDVSNITENSDVEKIHLSEFNDLPFDTSDKEETSEAEPVELEELNNLSVDDSAIDDNVVNDSDSETTNETELVNFDTLEINEEPAEETDFEDTEITSFEDMGHAEEPSIDEDETPITPESFEELELPEIHTEIEDEPAETSSAMSFDEFEPAEETRQENETDEDRSTAPFIELDTIYSEIPDEDSDEDSDIDLETNSEQLPADDISEDNSEISENINTGHDDFLESLASETPQEETTEIKDVVSYENSTAINNQNNTPGEIIIDINQPADPSQNSDDELEKLEVLYNEKNDITNEDDNLNLKTAIPEKGKKAIAIASVAVAALAALLIFASMNKSSEQVAEQNNTSVLEKNLPELDEQALPEDAAVLPAQTKPNLEETAKNAAQNVNKQNAPVLEEPYLDVKKLSWAVPDYISYNDQFRKYLQTAGKSLKLSLSSDLLLATEYAYSDQIQVNVVLSKEGSIQNANILQSSGSTQIDDIVLRTVNDTLKVLKAPAGVIVGDNIQLTLKIYL